jgi:hypothetical protein
MSGLPTEYGGKPQKAMQLRKQFDPFMYTAASKKAGKAGSNNPFSAPPSTGAGSDNPFKTSRKSTTSDNPFLSK